MARSLAELRLLLVDALASVSSKETEMNFTGGHTLPNIGKRINWQFITLAGGLAIALSAGALAGAFDRDAAPAETSQSRPAPAISTQSLPASRTSSSEVFYYIVGSHKEAVLLESALSTVAASFGARGTIQVVVAETPAQEAGIYADIAMAGAELGAHGIGLSIVDMRPQAAVAIPGIGGGSETRSATRTFVYVVGSHEERTVLERVLHEAAATTPDETRRSVLVIESGDEALYNTLVGDQMASGAFEVVDLRN